MTLIRHSKHLPLLLGTVLVILVYLLNGSADTLELLMSDTLRPQAWQLIMELRLPRLLLALTAGACLACSGLLLQSLTANSLADPGILGINQGAAIAVLVSSILFTGNSLTGQTLAAISGSLVSLLIIGWLSQKLTAIALILCGIGLSTLLSALLNLIMISAETHQINHVLTWLAGSLSGAYIQKALILSLLAFIAISLSGLLCRHLTPLLLDQQSALALGLGQSMRQLCLLMAGILSALAVTAVGALAFIGLLAPHIARLGQGKTPSELLLPSILWGCILCILADLIARSLFVPLQLPFGLIVAIAGVPGFIILFLRKPPVTRASM